MIAACSVRVARVLRWSHMSVMYITWHVLYELVDTQGTKETSEKDYWRFKLRFDPGLAVLELRALIVDDEDDALVVLVTVAVAAIDDDDAAPVLVTESRVADDEEILLRGCVDRDEDKPLERRWICPPNRMRRLSISAAVKLSSRICSRPFERIQTKTNALDVNWLDIDLGKVCCCCLTTKSNRSKDVLDLFVRSFNGIDVFDVNAGM